jgi:hypothetical protein
VADDLFLTEIFGSLTVFQTSDIIIIAWNRFPRLDFRLKKDRSPFSEEKDLKVNSIHFKVHLFWPLIYFPQINLKHVVDMIFIAWNRFPRLDFRLKKDRSPLLPRKR